MGYVILGNGVAGFTAAKILREEDHDSEIILISEEPYLSYNRPIMTKAPLIGFNFSDFFIKQESWYQEKNITLFLNTKIVGLNPETKTIFFENKDSITYDKCIYALGGQSSAPPIDGIDQDFVLHFRTFEDVANIRKKLYVKTATIIGGGAVGIEVAWELKKIGIKVTLLEQADHLMKSLLDAQSAEVLETLISKLGIEVKTNVKIEKISADKQIILKNLDNQHADIIILCCGFRPNIELAKNSGINVNRSIIVNEKMQTNIQDIFACGDCVEYQGFNYGLWNEATAQAEIAAINASGKQLEYMGFQKTVLFNLMNFSLFAMGDLQKYFIIKEFHDINNPYFMVNEFNTIKYSYQKYFFDENKIIVGCVIIGNLYRMNDIKIAINEKWTLETFESEVAKW